MYGALVRANSKAMSGVVVEQEAVARDAILQPVWNLDLGGGQRVQCDAITAEPFRYSFYDWVRAAMETEMRGEESPKEKGARLMQYLAGSMPWEEAAERILRRPVLGEGMQSVVWLLLMAQERASVAMSGAWGGRSDDEWKYECAGIASQAVLAAGRADATETLAVPARRYIIGRGKSVEIVLKLSYHSDRQLRLAPVSRGAWMYGIGYDVGETSFMGLANAPLFELVCYSLLERFAAPVCPNVPALSKAAISFRLAQLQTRLVEGKRNAAKSMGGEIFCMVKAEERLQGLSMYALMYEPAGAALRDLMTLEDWHSVIWQSVMVHVCLCMTTGIVHRDAHMKNMVVHVMDRPMQLKYVCRDKGIDVTTQRSKLLVQRMDWSEGLPARSMSLRTRRAYACQRAFFLGYHTREIKKRMGDQELPDFCSLMFNDISETLSAFKRMFSRYKDRGSALSQFVTVEQTAYLCDTVQYMLNFVVFFSGTLLDGTIASELDALALMRNKLLIEGGWNVPDSWFEVSCDLMAQMVQQMSARLVAMLGASSSSQCVQLGKVEWEVTREGSVGRSFEALFEGPVLGVIEAPAVERNQEMHVKLVSRAVRMALGLEPAGDLEGNGCLQRMKRLWFDLPVVNKKAVEVQMLKLVAATLERPQVYTHQGCKISREDRDAYVAGWRECTAMGGMCETQLVQLANAASAVLGMGYVCQDFVQDVAEQKMVMRA